MAPSFSSCVSLSSCLDDGLVIEDDLMRRRRSAALEKEHEVDALLDLLDDDELSVEDLLRKLGKAKKGTLVGSVVCLSHRFYACVEHSARNDELCVTLRRKIEKLKCSIARLKCGLSHWKSCALIPCTSCDDMHRKNNDLSFSLACLKSENEMLKFNASMPCLSCVDLHKDLDKASAEIALFKSNVSLPCVSCESLLAEINELKLTHTTCVDELEHTKAKIDEISSRPCSLCSFNVIDDACLTSYVNHDAMLDVNDDVSSTGLICTSCIDLKNEVLALKKLCDDMSAKLVEHNEMSANLEKENELLRTTYAECIGKEMENLKNAPCGTCDRLKFENEVLANRCKSLCAKSLDSRDSYNSDVVVSEIASLQPELSSCVARESLDDSTCAKALDSSSIASPKLVASSGDVQGISHGKGVSHIFGTRVP